MSSITEIITKLSSAKRELFINELKNRSILEPIAIVGIGCRFPGNCNSPSSFWEMLRNSQDAICEVPKDRWDIEDFYDPDPLAPGKMNTRWGGFLKGVDLFDADFFSISPREAMHMDPQQRLLLEVAWEALDDAGLVVNKLAKTQTGVFLGLSLSDYGHLQWQNVDSVDVHVNTGSCLSIAAGRLSYSFDFRGPSFVVDTACSSSLVAINLACQSLWRGETTLALAGGASLMLLPSVTVGFTKLGAMSADGYCKTFDSRANGYVRGEGVGVVVLKTLSKALADGDQIYSVIRSCAVNQDGKSNGLTAPNLNSQENVLSQAYQQANISPNQIQYIEAHGTGTSLGDPIEVQALANVLSFGRSNENYCSIGSVKTNIGHLEAAAGIAGLIKVALSLKNKQIPPSLHFEKPNPLIDFDTLPIKVQTNLGPWPDETERLYAGISSFGFSGTNAHIVLEEWTNNNQNQEKDQTNIKQEHILLITGKTENAVKEQVIKYIDYLKTSKENLVDICFSSIVRRSHHNVKLTVIGKNKTEIIQALEEYQKEGVSKRIYIENNKIHKEEKIVFVCSGQGGQWWGMCRSYFNNDVVFRNTILKCDAILTEYTKFSLVDIFKLTEDVGKEKIKETSIAQPMIFAIEVALAEVYKSYGIEPSAIVGHSVGEIAAAYIAGVLTLKDAIKVVVYRSKLMEETKGQGKTIVIDINSSKIFKLLEKYPRLSIAAINSKSTTLVSGNIKDLEELIKDLEELTINSKYLQVDYPFHSKEMEQISKELEEILSMIEVNESKICLVSTVYGEVISGREMNRKYWGANLRKPVLFEQAIKKLAEFEIFIELGPHPTLLSHIATTIATDGKAKTFIASSNREYEDMFMLSCSLAKLLSKSYPIDWKRFYPSSIYTPLPSYSWQRQSFWLDKTPPKETKENSKELFSSYINLSTSAKSYVFELDLSFNNSPHIKDHCIKGNVVVAGATYIGIVFTAISNTFELKPVSFSLVNIEFKNPLFIFSENPIKLQLVIMKEKDSTTFNLSSLQNKDEWICHVSGQIELNAEIQTKENLLIEEVQYRCQERVSKEQYYDWMQEQGFTFGSNFHAIEQIWRSDKEVITKINLPNQLKKEAAKYFVHPVIIDSFFQTSLAGLIKKIDSRFPENMTVIPIKIGRITFFQKPNSENWSYWNIANSRKESNLEANLSLFDDKNRLVAEILDLSAKPIGEQKIIDLKDISNYFYKLSWNKEEIASIEKPNINNCLIFADKKGLANNIANKMSVIANKIVYVTTQQSYQRFSEFRYGINPDSTEDFLLLLKNAFSNQEIDLIVYLWNIDVQSEEHLNLSSTSLLYLLQALEKIGWRNLPALRIVTQNACSMGEELNPISIFQSLSWGFAKVIRYEQAGLLTKCIDIFSIENDIDQIVKEIISSEGTDFVVLRANNRYTAKLVREICKPIISRNLFTPNSTYLITGATGGLGLALVNWMIENSAKDLVLVGKNDLNQQTRDLINKLNNDGNNINFYKVDVSDPTEVKKLFNLMKDLPPLKGIFHLAGLLDDSFLMKLDSEKMYKVIAPKVKGAWNLHLNSLDTNLDFFVTFSSIASILGSPGQANYAAANAFLDALFHYRKESGLPATNINWGPWLDIGMAARGYENKLATRGISSLSPQQGMKALEYILSQKTKEAIVMDFDIKRWQQLYPQIALSNMFSLLEEKQEKGSKNRESLINQLSSAKIKDKQYLIKKYVKEKISQVLRIPENEIQEQMPLPNIGMDSMMALEFRSALELDLGISLPSTLVWAYPTTEALAGFLFFNLFDEVADASQSEQKELNEEAIDLLEQLKDL